MAYGYITGTVKKVIGRYGTRNPFSIMKQSGITLKFSDRYESLKGYYFYSLRSDFIVISSRLSEAEMRIVAAHELAHYFLHRDIAKNEPIRDFAMFDVKSRREYEANIFCAELLISDRDVGEANNAAYGDFFDMSRCLSVMPELLLFKLYSMNGRGYDFNLPIKLDSAFLRK